MIAVLTHHWAKSHLVDEARSKLDTGSEQAPGFVNRQTFIALDDPTQISSVA